MRNARLASVCRPKRIHWICTVNDKVVVDLHFSIVFSVWTGKSLAFTQHFIYSEDVLGLGYRYCYLVSRNYRMWLAWLSVALPDTAHVLAWHGATHVESN